MKLIRAVELPGRALYEFAVHLDETKTVKGEDGSEQPDPDWVAHRVWQVEAHPEQTDAAYQDAVLATLLADEWAQELERRQAAAAGAAETSEAAPVRLAVEGKRFTASRLAPVR